MSLSPTRPPLPNVPPSDEALQISGRSLAKLADTVTTEVRHYDFLRGIPSEEILTRLNDLESFPPEHRQAVLDIRQVLLVTKFSMRQMNEAYPGLPPDSAAKTIDLVSRPGASVVLLKGRDPTDSTNTTSVLGYGIVIKGKENFPDAEHIPEYLMKGECSHRVIRLFVTDIAREQLPPGDGFSRMIETIKSICEGGPVIGMVLTDIVPMEATGLALERKQIWLEAQKALEKRGFEDSGENITEVINHDGKPTVAIPFRWYVWPPISDSGRELYRRHQERFRMLEVRQRERLAGILPTLPLAGGIIQYAGSASDAFDVAYQFAGNLIHAQLFDASQRGANRRGRRPNLVYPKDAKTQASLPAGVVDTVILNGIIPDVTANDRSAESRQQRLDDFLRVEKEAIRPGGLLVIRDTVQSGLSGELILRLDSARTQPWSQGRTISELFQEFVATRCEAHIQDSEWNRVIVRGEHEGMTEFSAPAAIVHEFMAKFPYVSDWETERKRPYTQHSVEERIEQVRRDGFRLVYAGPEQSTYVRRQYRDGLVEIHDRAGRPHDLPPSNFLAIAQKVGHDEGLGFSVGPELPFADKRFVEVKRYERLDSLHGSVVGFREVASRPNVTLDIIPYSVAHGRLFVCGRMYPRPLTIVHPNLDGSVHGGYLTEQLATIVAREKLDSALGAAITAAEFLGDKNLAAASEIEAVGHTSRYFVRADTVDEEVVATAVLVPDLSPVDRVVVDPKNIFGGRYTVRTFDAVTVLQGQQTGFSEDPRLERKIYQLLRGHSLSAGPWLGDSVSLMVQEGNMMHVSSAAAVRNPPERQVFRLAADQECSFLSAHRREFSETMADSQREGRSSVLEYVEPHPSTGLGHESLAVLPIALRSQPHGDPEVVVGLEVKDLPAAQERLGSSAMITVPTTRVPLGVDSVRGARAHAAERLRANFGIESLAVQSLGGKYVVSPGVTPEVVYPTIVEVDLKRSRTDSLLWVPLRDLIPHISELHCGQAITLLYRVAHMLGMLES
jgi:hypothetical protein